MKTTFISLLVGCLIFTNCRNNNFPIDDNSSKPLYRIDLEQSITNVKAVPLTNIGKELEYIPLETNPACMISRISNVALTDSFIIVSDGYILYQFDRAGKFLREIGSPGRGPKEYLDVRDFTIDINTGDVYILSLGKVLVFSSNGQFKMSFKYNFIPTQIVIKDQNSLMFHQFNITLPSYDTIFSWYITDKQGKVLTKIENYLRRVSMPGFNIPNSPLYVFNGVPHFLEFGIDTLYYFYKSKKEPYAIFNLGKIKMDPDPIIERSAFEETSDRLRQKIWIATINESKDYLFLRLNWGLMDSTSYCIFNKNTLEITNIEGKGFKNDLDGGVTFWPRAIFSDSLLVDYIDAFKLLKYIKDKSVILRTKEIDKASQLTILAKQLTENSNPVIIVLK